MNIIIFGPPGAGKGTQSDFIVRKYNLFQVSTGKILREEIKDKTDLGHKISELMSSGSLVDDSIVNKLIEEIVSDKKYENRFIFDGYPRNLDQAYNLSNLLNKYRPKLFISGHSHILKIIQDREYNLLHIRPFELNPAYLQLNELSLYLGIFVLVTSSV